MAPNTTIFLRISRHHILCLTTLYLESEIDVERNLKEEQGLLCMNAIIATRDTRDTSKHHEAD